MLAARFAGRWSDTAITTLALVFYATPLFWIALMARSCVLAEARLVPRFGYETVGAGYTGLRARSTSAHHLILPAMTLGLFFTALYARMMRASMLEVRARISSGPPAPRGSRGSVIRAGTSRATPSCRS